MIYCQQKPTCPNLATHAFTWPGQDQSYICLEHALKLLGVASAMGMHVQIIPLTERDHQEKDVPPHAV